MIDFPDDAVKCATVQLSGVAPQGAESNVPLFGAIYTGGTISLMQSSKVSSHLRLPDMGLSLPRNILRCSRLISH